MDTGKTLTYIAFSGILVCGLTYYYPPTSSSVSGQPDPGTTRHYAELKANCEKAHNCTYQVAGAQRGTTSTVYEIDGLRFTIPDAFFAGENFSPKPATFGTIISVWLPHFAPLTLEERLSKTPRDSSKNSQKLSIRFHKNSRQPRAVHVQELEDKIIHLRQPPQPVPGIPSLQEYALPAKKSYFRAKDQNIRYYDGLPVYFVCLGDPVIFGYDPIANSKNARCIMGMTWPNGFEVDIYFDESLLPQWNTILGRATGFLKNLEDQNRLPSGTLALD